MAAPRSRGYGRSVPAPTPGPIARFLGEDHARLDALLARAVAAPDAVAREPYDAFRAGLLRHVALEEKILFRAVRETSGEPLPLQRRLRVDHGALAALLVPTPTPELVRELRSILDPHNAIEEGAGGLYELCDAILRSDAAAIVERMRAYPAVKVAAYNDGPRVLRTAAEALRVSALQAERR